MIHLLLLVPIAAGLAGTALPAFGYLPALGHDALSLEPWRQLLAEPGLGTSVLLALWTGIGSTALALLLAVLIAMSLHDTALRRLAWVLPPLLAVPHLAFAVGFAFLIAPSGLLVRLAAPLLGLDTPPDLALPQDRTGVGLLLGLALRETPFLLFVLLAALDRPGLAAQLAAARTLGCHRPAAWRRVVLPQIYPAIRLPVLAVLVYGLTNVEMALVLGPTAPPPLAVRVLRWLNDPDLGRRLTGAAGALLLLALTAGSMLLWLGGERVIRLKPTRAGGRETLARGSGHAALVIVLGAGVLTLLLLGLWSIAGSWRFPHLLPVGVGWGNWRAALPGLQPSLLTTALLGLASAGSALVLVVAVLEGEAGTSLSLESGATGAALLLWLPLLLPPVAFAFGMQALWIALGIAESWTALLWSHLLIVLPYVRLVLAGPWRKLDPQLTAAARSLGRGPIAVLVRIKLPLLLRPLLTAFATGFAVSSAQYVLTLAASGGRFPTLATETLALALGGDRRRVGVAAGLLALLPMLAALLALIVPALVERRRRLTARSAHDSLHRPGVAG